MIKKYRVKYVEGFDGLERQQDPPHHRKIYGDGEIIELDDEINNIEVLKNGGFIEDIDDEIIMIDEDDKESDN